MTSIFDPEHQHLDINSKIAAALERISQAFRVLLWKVNKNHNLSPIQIQFLVYLYYHTEKQTTITQLSREFSLTPATVSDAISTLEKKVLVKRKLLKKDNRVVTVSLTAAGKKTARRLSLWANILQDSIEEYNTDEKIIVMKFLMNLISSLQNAGIVTITRMCITCRFFQPNVYSNSDEPHHCLLLNKPLAETMLRLDCPDHEMIT